MSLLNKIDKAFTSVFALLILAEAAGSAFLAWNILGMTEQTLLIQIGGTILAAIIGAAIGWLALQVMKIFA